ncbi:MAG TPA: 50S ribosomal protein L15 [Candidatus Omnitrophica bacterium]|nr:50S ribosomal protein L15 [Candidatus Omnitrophota bacterium]
MKLNDLVRPHGSRKKRKIVGRGESSGHGKTSCRGHKGQGQRAGRGTILGFEGGQNPLIRRIPKRGFNSRNKKEYQIVSIDDLIKIKSNDLIGPEVLETKGFIKDKNKPVKILSGGEISKPLVVQAHAFSKSAKALIEKAGGKAECLKV